MRKLSAFKCPHASSVITGTARPTTTLLSGKTNTTLRLDGVLATDIAGYQVVITNGSPYATTSAVHETRKTMSAKQRAEEYCLLERRLPGQYLSSLGFAQAE